uniref:DUF7869 domain-containing protein n=2 Tax=Schizaphis graminum TaxID=13262 RepID=A0A2S2NJY1_SCHGA
MREKQYPQEKIANLTLYSRIFNTEFNISFFVPKKDQCSLCESYKNADDIEKVLKDEKYQLHLSEKNLSRIEKENDKQLASNDINRSNILLLACYDLQAVLPTPRGEVSVFYYKSKLSTYNFTISDIVRKESFCYVWNEGEAKKGVNEIGTSIIKFLQSECNIGKTEVIFYSDNCAGQNKNKFITSLYLYATTNMDIDSITHKFLVVGHTQNEGDTAHSVIEKQIKKSLKSGPIYLPTQYVSLIQTAKKTGHPFKVKELGYSDFYDIKNITECNKKNYSINYDGEKVIWNNIKVLRVEKAQPNTILYKTSFSDTEFKKINLYHGGARGRNPSLANYTLKQAYTQKNKISVNKKRDLMSLCQDNYIPNIYHDFYKSLQS